MDSKNIKIKKIKTEARVYALLITGADLDYLYLGANYSMEEAYAEARNGFFTDFPEVRGKKIHLDAWNIISANILVDSLIELEESPPKVEAAPEEKTILGQLQTVREAKNILLTKIIKDEKIDDELRKDLKKVLLPNEIILLEKSIEKRKNKRTHQ